MNLGNDFHSAWVLWGLLVLPLVFWRDYVKHKKAGLALGYSDGELLKKLPISMAQRLRPILIVLRMSALACLIIALARPRMGETFEEITSEGVDILLTLDLSGSMQHLDLLGRKELQKISRKDPERFFKSGEIHKYSRLGAAKKTISEFIEKRQTDRLGLVVFAGRAMTQCPLTVDYGILQNLLEATSHETIPVQGTAIGDALMTSVQRLKESKAESKVVILLTDGANNAGKIHPEKAAAVAQAIGVKVYTIGVGRKDGRTLMPGQNVWTGEVFWDEKTLSPEEMVDEEVLISLAEKTGGEFFRASNKKQLEDIYTEIDELEKTEVETYTFTKYHELFFPWLLAGVLLFFLELILAHTRFRTLP